ncbi:hypothetical protein A8M57_06225 [Yersinia pestis]|nr:hypothetical protein A8M57_06225 [Yersinia pestis]
MIPQISQAPGVIQSVLDFLDALKQNGFTGDTATNYADRLTMATDNSIYQLLPDAVVFPRSTADVALVGRLAGWRVLNHWYSRHAAGEREPMVRR